MESDQNGLRGVPKQLREGSLTSVKRDSLYWAPSNVGAPKPANNGPEEGWEAEAI